VCDGRAARGADGKRTNADPGTPPPTRADRTGTCRRCATRDRPSRQRPPDADTDRLADPFGWPLSRVRCPAGRFSGYGSSHPAIPIRDALRAVKAIPGRRWDPERSGWLLADSPANRKKLYEHFAGRLDSPGRSEASSDAVSPGSDPAVALLDKMRGRMLLHGFSPKARKCYLGHVRRLLGWTNASQPLLQPQRKTEGAQPCQCPRVDSRYVRSLRMPAKRDDEQRVTDAHSSENADGPEARQRVGDREPGRIGEWRDRLELFCRLGAAQE
jgi:hypothetical protein